jgi:hypothetical protein
VLDGGNDRHPADLAAVLVGHADRVSLIPVTILLQLGGNDGGLSIATSGPDKTVPSEAYKRGQPVCGRDIAPTVSPDAMGWLSTSE